MPSWKKLISSGSNAHLNAVTASSDIILSPTNKLYLDSGTHTYISETSDDNLKFYVGGTNLLSMIEGGTNVIKAGDGTYLGVGDSIDLYMYHTGGASFINNGTGMFTIRNQAQDQDIRFSVNDGGVTSNILTLNAASSRVGIGTTAPATNLEIKDTRPVLRLTDDSSGTIDTAIGTIEFYSEDTSGNYPAVGASIKAMTESSFGSGHGLAFLTNADSASPTERMRIDEQGNVGIGTLSPSAKFEVVGGNLRWKSTDDANTGVQLYSSNGNRQLAFYGYLTSYSALQSDNTSTFKIIQNNADGDIQFLVKPSSTNTQTDALRIDGATANVGIGVASPAETLHVDGSIEFAGRKYNRGSVSVAGAGTANGQAITLSDELGTTLNVNYQYKITLSTTGTGTDTGAVYVLTYDQDGGAWDLRLVSRAGSSSNHPLAVVDGSNLKAYHNHASTYNILYFVEFWDMSFDDGTLHGWGSDYQWQRDVDKLYYNDGNVGIGTSSPSYELEVAGTGSFAGIVVGGGTFTSASLAAGGSGGGGGSSDITMDGSTANGLLTFGGTDNIDVESNLTFDGSTLTVNGDIRINDSSAGGLEVGTSQDLQIYHNGTNSFGADNYTGHLIFQQRADDQDIIFKNDDGAGGVTEYITLDGSAGRTLFNKDIRVNDSVEVQVGSSADLRILHDGTNSEIKNYTGNFYITQHLDDGDIILRSDDGSGGVTEYFRLDGGTERVEASKSFRWADSGRAQFGASSDLQIYHDGSNSYITNGTGHLYIQSTADNQDIFVQATDNSTLFTAIKIDGSVSGSVSLPNDNQHLYIGNGNDLDLYHQSGNSIIKNVTGQLILMNTAQDQDIAFQVNDGGSVQSALRLRAADKAVRLPYDNQVLSIGASDDLKLTHNGSHSYIQAYGTGNLYIDQNNDDADIVFRSDDGSGGVTPYITLDGSAATVNIDKEINLAAHLDMGDDDRIRLGASGDLQIVHTSNINFIHSTISDRDIYFRVDDGGSSVDAIIIDASEIGRVKLPNDGQKLAIGASEDLTLHHTSGNSFIANTTTGDLYIQNSVDDKDIILRSDDGSGGVTPYITLDGSTVRTDFDKPIEINDSAFIADSSILYFGAGNDLRIQHNGSANFIQSYGGAIYIDQIVADEDIVFRNDDGAGSVTTYMRIDGGDERIVVKKSLRSDDNVALAAGTDGDLNLVHNGTDSYLENWTGDLYIKNNNNDKDVKIQSDDNSGGVTDYITLDGSTGELLLTPPTRTEVQGNLVVEGDLTAQNYIVSSSVTYMTQSFSSGSTIFGDSASDTHQFTGSLFISSSASPTAAIQVGEGNTARVGMKVSSDRTMFGYDGGYAVVQGGGSKGVRFRTNNDTFGSGTEAMTITYGGQVNLPNDSQKLTLGASQDLELYHDGTNSIINNTTGALHISQSVSDADILFSVNDGGTLKTALKIDSSEIGNVMLPNWNQALKVGASGNILLYHNSSAAKFVNITGDMEIENTADDKDIILKSDDGSGGTTAYLTLDGSATATKVHKNLELADNVQARFGAGDDLQIYHDGSNSVINHAGTGDLQIYQNQNDKDIILLSDDGSGGTTAYLTLDGSATQTLFHQDTRLQVDNKSLSVGANNDLRMIHATHSYLQNTSTSMLVIQNTGQDQDIAFMANDNGSNNHVMRIKGATGFVGIGTTSPSVKLDVAGGDIAIDATQKLYLDGGTHTYIDEPSGDQLRLVAGGTEVLKGYSGGAIDMYGGSINRSINIGANRTGDAASFIDLVGDTTYTDYGARLIRNSGANAITDLTHRGTGALRLRCQDAGAVLFMISDAEKMRVASSGNVGIGTTSPGEKLVVAGAIKASVAENNYAFEVENSTEANFKYRIYNDGSTTGEPLTFRTGLYYGTTENSSIHFYRGASSTGGYMTFQTNNGNERMRIDSSGKVGIGTTSPQEKLDVVSGSAHIRGVDSEGYVLGLGQFATTSTTPLYKISTFDNTSGGTSGLTAGDHLEIYGTRWGFQNTWARGGQGGAVPVASLYSSAGESRFSIYEALNPTTDGTYSERIRLRGDGDSWITNKLGIGTTSPDTTLDVFSSGVNGILLNQQTSDSNTSARLMFKQDDTTWTVYGTGGNLSFRSGGSVGGSSGSEQFRITVNDGIRIPNDSDSLRLGAGDDLRLYHDGTDSWVRNFTGHLYIRNDGSDKDIYFGTSDAGTNAYVMAIDGSEQRVGIGTTSPADKMHIYLSGSGTGLRLQGAGGSTSIRYQNDAQSWYTGINSSEQFYWYSSQLAATTAFINTDGNFYNNYNFLASTNNAGYSGRDTGGTVRNVIKINSSNQVQIGDDGHGGNHLHYPATYTQISTNYGYVNIGAQNSSHMHLITDRSNIYTTSYLNVNNAETIRSYSSDFVATRAGSSTNKLVIESNGTRVHNTLKAEDGLYIKAQSNSGTSGTDGRQYLNVFSYRNTGAITGAFIIHTDIGRASNKMGKIHVHGHAYGQAETIDFQVVFYMYSGQNGDDGVAGQPYATSIIDNGDDGFNKYLGVDADGNLAIAIDEHNGTSKYYYHFTADMYLGTNPHDPVTDWSGSVSTTDGFNWLHKEAVVPKFHFNSTRYKLQTDNGYIEIGPQNSGYAHYKTDRAANYFDKRVVVDQGIVASYDEDLILRRADTNSDYINIQDDRIVSYVGGAEKLRVHNDYFYMPNKIYGGDGSETTPMYNFWNDSNSGMYRYGADDIGFTAGGNVRFRANGNGLDLGGNSANKIVHTNTSTRDKYRVWTSSAYAIGMQSSFTFGGLENQYAMTFQMNNQSSERGFWWGDDGHNQAQGAMALTTAGELTVAHSARIGYGESDTTTPGATYRLDVSGNGYISGDLWISQKLHTWSSPTGHVASIENNGTYLMMRNPEGNVGIYLGDSGDAQNYYQSGAHKFRSYDGSTYFANLNSTGLRIGTGNTNASTRLDVDGTSNFTGEMYIDHGGSDYAPGINFMGGTNTPGSNTYENCKLAYYDNSGTGTMQYSIGRGAGSHKFNIGGSTVFYVDSGGQGRFIGATDIGLVVQSNDSGGGIAIKDSNTSGDYYNGVFCSGNDLFLKANNTERLRVKSDGNIDISNNLLFGSGNIWQLDQGSWTGGSANQANVMLTGAAGTFGIHSNTSTVDLLVDGAIRSLSDVVAFYSDIRLKHKFEPITSALEKVQSLEGFTYESNELAKELGYNEDYDNLTGKRKVGVSAQQVQEVLPEAVTLAPFDTHKNEDGTIESKSGEDYLTVKYEKMVPLLIESIKELKSIVETQNTTIEQQQQRLTKLEEKSNG